MATATESIATPPVTPLSFSLLISSPIRRNIPFAPVTAAILPLAKVKLPYASLVVATLDIFTAFLAKRFTHELASPQNFPRENYPVTLTLAQLADLIQNYSQGQSTSVNPSPCRPVPQGALNGDEPLFPDHLSVSLLVSGPFDGFDGSPDSSFNVPLFSIPGVPGNLIIAVITLIAQFLLEQANVNGSAGTAAPQCLRR
ncbi:hypothetical protein AAC978_01650 [Desulfitobacterium sp. THU1]|uniref:hypothetical protein n=1 Tax=Desulfitobacterium sp. THU1 TaxID=3138072 RepID=UPI0031201DF2